MDSYDVNVDNLIICGDINAVLDQKLDNIASRNHSEKTVNIFNKFVTDLKVNVFRRYQHGEQKSFTWSRQNPFIACRPDYILVSEPLLQKCNKSEIQTYPNTDHKIVNLILDFESTELGPGYWKLNNNHLFDKEFKTCIRAVIRDTIKKYKEINDQLLWEICKSNIKQAAIEFEHIKAKETKNRSGNIRTYYSN